MDRVRTKGYALKAIGCGSVGGVIPPRKERKTNEPIPQTIPELGVQNTAMGFGKESSPKRLSPGGGASLLGD